MLNYSKTDDKDLRAIGQAIIANNGLSEKRFTDRYEQMQLVCRPRRQLMTLLFREFQGLVYPSVLKKQKIYRSFWGWRSRLIMRHCPWPDEILSYGEKGLQELALSHGLKLRDQEIQLLLQAAHSALAVLSPEWARFQGEQSRKTWKSKLPLRNIRWRTCWLKP